MAKEEKNTQILEQSLEMWAKIMLISISISYPSKYIIRFHDMILMATTNISLYFFIIIFLFHLFPLKVHEYKYVLPKIFIANEGLISDKTHYNILTKNLLVVVVAFRRIKTQTLVFFFYMEFCLKIH